MSNLTRLEAVSSSLDTAINKVETLPNKGSATEDLNTELTTQEDLISQLSTILDSKASGGSSGGSVETVSGSIFRISKFDNVVSLAYKDGNGQVVFKVDGMNQDLLNFNNVAKNTTISIFATGESGITGTESESIYFDYCTLDDIIETRRYEGYSYYILKITVLEDGFDMSL